MNPPDEFLCPITLEVMKDPVIMSDGHTYERSAIRAALDRNQTSPLTRAPMTIDQARPNYVLKNLINDWVAAHAGRAENEQDPPEAPAQMALGSAPESIRHINLSRFTPQSHKRDGTSHVHVQVTPAPTADRVPLALIAMIDVSGSMWDNPCADVRGMEELDISRLELVQHALKTIIETFGATDELSFVQFDHKASVCLRPTKMDTSGKRAALRALSEMDAAGGTNIWDALRVGLAQAKLFEGRGFNTSLLLFTDGEPNQNPPMGLIPTLEKALAGMKQDFTISTFGFGYSVDSDLMENIARLGHGVYGYCPDCTMVGTTFVNFIASALATVVQRAVLEVRAPGFSEIYDLTLVNESSRNVLVDVPESVLNEMEVVLSIPSTGDRFSVNQIDPATDPVAATDQVYRRRFIKVLTENLFNPEKAPARVRELFDEIKSVQPRTKYLDSLALDLVDQHPNHGQVLKAFEPAYFAKWGKDYLRSLALAHETEMCANFKDESLQSYGGPKFAKYRTVANDLFLNIPLVAGNHRQEYRTRGTYVAPIAATTFYNYHGGCFDGNAGVALRRGVKQVRDLVKGDVLKGGAVVECVVETTQWRPTEAVVLNGVAFTPFHPVEIAGEWVFPRDVAPVVTIRIDAWFNLVLRGQKVVELNGVRAITLGHGQKDGILMHPYFGTDAVVTALKRYPDYNSGRVHIIEPMKCERDENGMIVALF